MPPAQLSPDNNGGYNIFAAKACQCLRALGSVMVMIVLGLILLTYYTTVFLVYGKLLFVGGNKAIIATVVIVIYNLLIFMLLWSYFAAVLTEPGRVPPGWQPSESDEEGAGEGDDARATARAGDPKQGRRFCRKCSAWKPDRTHHCSVCGRCILKMDHHCVWVANCVGVYNYKFFLLFLFYTFLTTIFDAAVLLPDFIHFFRGGGAAEHAATVAFVFLTVVLDLAFAASLLGFIVMHSNLVSQNMTTIEMYEKKKSIPWRYDYGKQKNFAEVFGQDKLFWLMPMHTETHLRDLDVAAGISNYVNEGPFHLPA